LSDGAVYVTSKLTYIDSGVLISAFRGSSEISVRAAIILDDQTRRFASSPFVILETLPKATYHRQNDEQEFYNAFFDAVGDWANDVSTVVDKAKRVSSTYGIAAMDALHISAALHIGAEEFVTTEKPSKPMFRVKEIQMRSIFNG
jgi:predicted nucleic acid-binding protein